MKVILCFGDSNTWGANPADQKRHPRQKAWPAMLQQELGSDYLVIGEGLPGRTTVWDDPIEGYKNGKSHLMPLLDSHKPLDLVIIMLGTNDLKARFSVTAFDIATSAGSLVDMVRQSLAGPDEESAPQVLLMAPPPTAKIEHEWFTHMFQGGEAKSKELGAHFARVAAEKNCPFLDAGSVIVSSPVDGIHFELEEHAKLGRAVAQKVKELLG